MKNLSEKHNKLVNNYSLERSKHLERQANLALKQKDHEDKLRQYSIEGNFFDLFDTEAID